VSLAHPLSGYALPHPLWETLGTLIVHAPA